MNFYGHFVFALDREQDPRFLLGAMAPDFASMAGLRLRRSEGEDPLARGIAFHHASDDAFHGAPLFLELMREARVELEGRGVGTGAAMGIGHVGVELLLDGVLVERRGVSPLYAEAVALAPSLGPELAFRGADEEAARATWRAGCERLAGAPVPQGYTDPEFVAERLVRILSRRRRLAVIPGREPEVSAWAIRAAPAIAGRADELLAQVTSRLGE